MKKILILVCALALIGAPARAQKTPCDIKKQDWQTAVSNADGAILYMVETSNCNEGEMCGQPKVVLKHTFVKPAWFKIRLRGYNCNGELLENDFATGIGPIYADTEFLSPQNWHTFKKIVKVVSVDVNYDKVIPQNIQFNEESLAKANQPDDKNIEPKEAAQTPPAKTPEKGAERKSKYSPQKKTEAPVTNTTGKKTQKPETPASKPAPTPETQTTEIPAANPQQIEPTTTQVTEDATKTTPTEQPKDKTVETTSPVSEPAPATSEPKAKEKPANTATEPIVEPTIVNAGVKVRHNVIKTNIFYPLSMGFERHIISNISLVVNGFYFPGFSSGDPNGKFAYLELTNPSTGFSAEARYYTSKTKAHLNGFFLGGFYSVRNADVLIHKISSDSDQEYDAKISIPTGIGILGVMVGKQKIRAKGFTTDFSLGLGYFEAFGVPDISSNAKAPFDKISPFTKYKKGIAPRMTFSLGYAF